MKLVYRLKNLVYTLMLVCTFTLAVMPNSAYASEEGGGGGGEAQQASQDSVETYDTGDAIQDILKDGRFEGAMSSIRKITDFIDIWFIRIISIVSFFIISSALLKNVCAAAYVSNSKFWDKVDEAHKKRDALSIQAVMQFVSSQGYMQMTPATLGDFVFGIIPNIKGCTDFDDADMEPKAYFMKSIPQMCACVCIGVFIYNGYYRDTAATVGDMGAVIIERVLTSVNPTAFLDKLANTTGWPDFVTKNDSSKQGKTEYAISKELRSAIASTCTDITSAEAKANVVGRISNSVRQVTQGTFAPYYVDVKEGEFEYNVTSVKCVVGARMDNLPTGMCEVRPEDSKGNIPFQIVFDMNELSGNSMDVNSGNNTLYVTGYFKKSVAKGSSKGTSDTDVHKDEDAPGGTIANAIEITSTETITAKSAEGGKIKFDEAKIGFDSFTDDSGESLRFSRYVSNGKKASAGISVELMKVNSQFSVTYRTQGGITATDKLCLGTYEANNKYYVLYVNVTK